MLGMDPSHGASVESAPPSIVSVDETTSDPTLQRPPTLQSNESVSPLIAATHASASAQAAEHPPQPQGEHAEQGVRKVPSDPKSKGKKICCPSTSTSRNICVSADGTLGEFGEKVSRLYDFSSPLITLMDRRRATLWNFRAVSSRMRAS